MIQNNNIEVIREINNRYSVIKYFDAEVIYDKETKFINATKLCQHISKVTGKEKIFRNWLALKQTQDFMKDISEKVAARIPDAILDNNEEIKEKADARIPAAASKSDINKDKKADARIPAAASKSDINEDKKADARIPAAASEYENILYYKVLSGNNKNIEIRGTYLHLDLIPQLCNWASKEYAFKISYIINYINGIKDYDSAYSKLKDEKLESKMEEIKKLEEEYQKQIKAKDEEIKRIKEEQHKQIEEKDKEIKDLNKELKETKKEVKIKH